jgi:hypothetical protein
MRTVSFSLLITGLLVCLVVLPYGADAQGRTIQDCRNNVADALGMNASNVQANVGPDGENGSPVVEWEANLGGRRIRGFCETNRNGQVMNTQLGVPRGGARFGGGGSPGGGFGGGGFGGFGRNNEGGGFGRNTGGGAIFSVRVDTSGRGTFSGMGQSVRITRGWVDTRNEPSIALSGEGDFKITFYGSVTGSNQDREFTLRITNSDRGNATGTATVRLNSDRNEVEYIKVDGRLGRTDFSGIFNRN